MINEKFRPSDENLVAEIDITDNAQITHVYIGGQRVAIVPVKVAPGDVISITPAPAQPPAADTRRSDT
jgi:hypothetical protein